MLYDAVLVNPLHRERLAMSAMEMQLLNILGYPGLSPLVFLISGGGLPLDQQTLLKILTLA